MSKIKTIWLAAGGTGGHVFPAISLAHELASHADDICLITDKRGVRLVQNTPAADKITIRHIPSASPFAGSIVKRVNACLILLFGGVCLFGRIVRKRPACIIGFGGYPSFMPALVARLFGIPLIMHEQNAIMGRSNRYLAGRAKLVMTSWPDTQGLPQKAPTLHTGLPIRSEFGAIKTYKPAKNGKLQILVIGGSQGAYLFGTTLVDAILSLPDELKKSVHITHQVRKEQQAEATKRYLNAGISADIDSFFHDMPKQMEQSDIILCRAGASSVAEIASAGRAAILIPFAHALDNHQFANADNLAQQEAAIVLEEKDCSAETLAGLITSLITSAKKRKCLAKAARKYAHVNAAEKMAQAVLHIICQPQETS